MDSDIKITIWDNMGKDKNMTDRYSEGKKKNCFFFVLNFFSFLKQECIRGMDGVMILYDVSVESTFHSARKWLEVIQFMSQISDEFKTISVLVGLKADQKRVRIFSIHFE